MVMFACCIHSYLGQFGRLHAVCGVLRRAGHFFSEFAIEPTYRIVQLLTPAVRAVTKGARHGAEKANFFFGTFCATTLSHRAHSE